MVEIKQPLHEILVDRWSTKRQQRPEEWKRYFHLEYKPYYGGLQWFYVFTDTRLFELKVEPHWLTHVRVIDPLAIEREAELDAWMEMHYAWPKFQRFKGRRQWSCNTELRRRLERQARLDLHRLHQNSEEAEMRSSIWRLHFSFFVFPHVAQRRGTPLRTEQVRVQVLPWGPLSLP